MKPLIDMRRKERTKEQQEKEAARIARWEKKVANLALKLTPVVAETAKPYKSKCLPQDYEDLLQAGYETMMIALKEQTRYVPSGIVGKVKTAVKERFSQEYRSCLDYYLTHEMTEVNEVNALANQNKPTILESVDLTLTSDAIRDVLRTLTERERIVTELSYNLNREGEMTRADIVREFNTYPYRIIRVQKKALRKLKHPSRIDRLKMYA